MSLSKVLILITAALMAVAWADGPKLDAVLVFDDFDDIYGDPINRSYLGAYAGYSTSGKFTKGSQGYWYVYSSSAAKITNPGGTELTESNIKSAFSTEDKLMHFMFDMSAAETDDYAAMACNMLSEGDYVDLSKMTSVILKVKGSGTMRMMFPSKYIKDNYDWGELGYVVDLTSAWKIHEIDVSDIVPAEWSDPETDGITWADVRTEISAIAFEAVTVDDEKVDADVYIDSIVFNGMMYGDLVDEYIPDAVLLGNDCHKNTAQRFSISNNILTYSLPHPENVTFSIIDLQGNLVRQMNATGTTGTHKMALPALSTGNYFVKMQNAGGSAKKISIVR